MSSEFDHDMDFFEHFHGFDQEPFDFSEYCNDADYEIDSALEAQTLDHPATDAGGQLCDPDASAGVLEPNQASLHEGPSAILPRSNQSELVLGTNIDTAVLPNHLHSGGMNEGEVAAAGSAPPSHPNMIGTAAASSAPPYKCTETDCRSKAKFKTLSQFRQHVRNIHQQPLLCTVPGCTYPRPFGKESDLIRHMMSKHEATSLFTCPDESCPGHFDGFKRQDKLLKHLREHHPQVQCQQTHCSAVVADCQQQSHIEEAHGSFQCAIGPCLSSPPSNFTLIQLKRHLKAHHKLSPRYTDYLTSDMGWYQSGTIKSEDLPDNPRKPRWEICSICGIGGVTAPISEDV
ncbi:unnamed protein product [Clonostachys solani]|uniref:C2H2-type domain-containing protein n=1 Tax=Clonostachys solani TaxID=160281 RepID=A0A9N9ZBQ3_9HYPO|nr:unnamed protein product [Clonostachys solani]